jgi:hypothetical protein
MTADEFHGHHHDHRDHETSNHRQNATKHGHGLNLRVGLPGILQRFSAILRPFGPSAFQAWAGRQSRRRGLAEADESVAGQKPRPT